MNVQFKGSGMELVVTFSIVSAIFWMVVGWRAMRAHEVIADACENWLFVRRLEKDAVTVRESPKPPIAQPVVTEADFTPHQDAPPEYPWSKEI